MKKTVKMWGVLTNRYELTAVTHAKPKPALRKFIDHSLGFDGPARIVPVTVTYTTTKAMRAKKSGVK